MIRFWQVVGPRRAPSHRVLGSIASGLGYSQVFKVGLGPCLEKSVCLFLQNGAFRGCLVPLLYLDGWGLRRGVMWWLQAWTLDSLPGFMFAV